MKFIFVKGHFYCAFDVSKSGRSILSPIDIVDPKTKKVVVKAGRRITRFLIKQLKELEIKEVEIRNKGYLWKGSCKALGSSQNR